MSSSVLRKGLPPVRVASVSESHVVVCHRSVPGGADDAVYNSVAVSGSAQRISQLSSSEVLT